MDVENVSVSQVVRADPWRDLWREARDVTDYRKMLGLVRQRRRLVQGVPRPSNRAAARIALLSGSTVDMIAEPLSLAIEAAGVNGELHMAPYGTYASELLDPLSGTTTFNPDLAVVLLTPHDIGEWPAWDASAETVRTAAETVASGLISLCTTFHKRSGADLILSNFHGLPTRPYGAAGTKQPGEPNRFLMAVNTALADLAPSYVHILDVAALAAHHGVLNWVDARYWHEAKQPVAFACLPALVRGIAQEIGARYGCSAKCVVLDLDNTLWGGVVGDDGVDALKIGQGDPTGEAYQAFQHYLKALKSRGIMLAVCSKNEEVNALAPFRERDEMVLRRDDIVAFVANWSPKSENIRRIAKTLNIGLDALIFVDDNPFERGEVRQALPEVRVVELPEDPAGYVAALDQTGWLETLSISSEDAARSEMYANNAARQSLLEDVTDYGAYLASLNQVATVGPFEERRLDRIAQLVGKSNQFNLTTERLSRAELATMMGSPDHVTLTGQLSDRFGDNGLITVLAGRRDGDVLEVVLWLMSCRVLKRGMENYMLNTLVDAASAAGCRQIRGIYRPTVKNVLVRDHYADLGFQADGGTSDGETHWLLELDGFEPFETSIRAAAQHAEAV
ncbi:MAG: HAD-IIIC family phosphatase [Pseudomonadota bacterium]